MIKLRFLNYRMICSIFLVVSLCSCDCTQSSGTFVVSYLHLQPWENMGETSDGLLDLLLLSRTRKTLYIVQSARAS